MTPANKTSQNDWESRAKDLLSADRVSEARDLLQHQDPQDPQGRNSREILLARTEAKLGEFASAQRRIDEVLELLRTKTVDSAVYPLKIQAMLVKSDILLQARGIEEQRVFLEECLRSDLSNVDRSKLMVDLAFNRRKAGRLREASALIGKAIDLHAESGSEPPLYYYVNLALVAIHGGDFNRASECLGKVDAALKTRGSGHLRAPFELVSALLALQTRDLRECERALARADQAMSGENFRQRVIWAEYKAELRMLQGMFNEAREILDSYMSRVNEKAAHSDLVPELARRLASVYLELDRPADALSYAIVAMRDGSKADLLEEIAGIRLACECYVALGDLEAAQTHLEELTKRSNELEFASERAAIEKAVARVRRLERISHLTRPHSRGRGTAPPDLQLSASGTDPGKMQSGGSRNE